jgi:hypothetical protein
MGPSRAGPRAEDPDRGALDPRRLEEERLIPLLAALAEVLPWVKQWHGEIDPAFGTSPAEAYADYLEAQQLKHGLTTEALQAWRPEKKSTRGRKPKPKVPE